MAYYIDLFTPETYQAFLNSTRDISGGRARHRGIAASIKPGDRLACYVTRLSRWVTSDQAKYDVVDSYATLIELVK